MLVDRVDDARASQRNTILALERARAVHARVAAAEPGKLELAYRDLEDAYDNASDKAKAFDSDIVSIKRVAADLFNEWNDDLAKFEDAELRAASEAEMMAARARYDTLIARLDQTDAALTPVLTAFRDRTLLLKHNMNGDATAKLMADQADVDAKVTAALAELDASIAAATTFVAEAKSQA
ncbi:MAG: DUF2959 family protein [Pseudomonadota bacterium]